MLTGIDGFINTSSEEIVRLIKAKEWSDMCTPIRDLGYLLKFKALTSYEKENSRFSEEVMVEFREAFYSVGKLVHDLMITSRYL